MKVITFLSGASRVGKTSLVYHLAWMLGEMGRNVVVADLDPQSYLTSMFVEEDRLGDLWPHGKHPLTIEGAVEAVHCGNDGVTPPHIERISDRIGLLPGDPGLSALEDKLCEDLQKCNSGDEPAFRAITAVHRAIALASQAQGADIVLLDTGPNLGPLNRSALTGTHHVIISLAPSLVSLRGLRCLGAQFRAWRSAWSELRQNSPDTRLPFSSGSMDLLGYVVMQQANRSDAHWVDSIPAEFSESMLGQGLTIGLPVEEDSNCLASLKQYRSLLPMAIEARKPVFLLKPADGAIGAHGEAVRDCYRGFAALTNRILEQCRLQ